MGNYAATTDERGAWDAGDKVEAVKMVRRRLNVSLPMAMKIMQGGDTEPSEVDTLRAEVERLRAKLAAADALSSAAGEVLEDHAERLAIPGNLIREALPNRARVMDLTRKALRAYRAL